MGLLNHDDDYVSPFDDGLPSYIDPSQRADYLSEIVETKHQMHEAAERRAKEWAAASRKPAKAQSSQTSGQQRKPSQQRAQSHRQQNRQRNTQTQHPSPSGHGSNRRPNPVVARQNATKPRKKRHAFFWMIIVFAVLWGLADPILNTANNWLGSIVHSSSSSAHTATGKDSGNASDDDYSSSTDSSNSTDDGSYQTVEKTSDVLDVSGKPQGVLTIASAKSGPNDFTGRPTVIVTFNWTNTSKKALAFDTLTHPEVYQNGLQLGEITFSKSTEVSGYSYESAQTEVKPGSEFNTTLAFTLRDKSSPIYVQSDRSTWYRESPLIVSAFTPNSDVSDGPWTQVNTSTLAPVPQATESDRKNMKTLGKTEYDQFFYALAGAQRGPADAMDNPSAIVSIDWINDTGNNASLSYFGDVSVTQNGVKLDNAYYLTNPEGFVDNGHILNSQPGVKATVQYAVELRDETSPITVTFTPYDNGKPESKTFQLE
ncbi:DUF5067 domain-containing protein [Bifidobacterium saguini]|uniref:DUF5067 domain-containing protein n=1 Tax=Bifidobacterium saguini TaxID=762210 RepID=A0ABX7SB32_9BIFI|nr:DUF5067 domain-containing protein [Bifidobacterium saguini]QTB90562.1 DUF5067 domain-containing protein [Bifidobacterium saguini]